MTTKQEDILRKVRGLIAKAQGTEFEAEREAFMAKADGLMEAYAIEEYMLATGSDEQKARLVTRRDFEMAWWRQLKGVEYDAKNCVYWLFNACVRHCRCYTTTAAWDYSTDTMAIYGMQADLTYLDLLFTDLFVQLFAKIKPSYDSNKSLGENVMLAKEAGMKYTDIAVWAGHPEWVEPNGTGGVKTCDGGKMLRDYKRHLESIGKTTRDVVSVNPKAYQYSYCYAFYSTVSERLAAMRDERETEQTGSMALALRDIDELAKEALWDDFPDLRPHPVDCTCQPCKDRRKPVRKSDYRQGFSIVAQGYGAGKDAGGKARIASRDGGLGRTKELKD